MVEQGYGGCPSLSSRIESPPILLIEDRGTFSSRRSSTRKELRTSRLPAASGLRHGNEDVLTERHGATFPQISRFVEPVHAFETI